MGASLLAKDRDAVPIRLEQVLGSLAQPFASKLAPTVFSESESALSYQNAGSTAPLYFSWMNCFTSGECRAPTSFFSASESLLSGRATRMFT